MSQFVGLFRVGDLQCVQVTRASDLELGLSITLADLDKLGVASACLLKKVSDIGNLLWHFVNYISVGKGKNNVSMLLF